VTIEHRPTKANELPLIEAPATAELIGVLDGATGRVPVARIAELVAEGKSTYQVAVANGFEGTAAEWLDSIIGDLVDQAGLDEAEAQAARDAALAAQAAAEAAADNAVAVSGLSNLSAAALRIAQAADVKAAFVYDTRKDSDGGAWRYHCALKSWALMPTGTATRGVRATFPALAMIVARETTLAIYDADDPACPMWFTVQATASPTSQRNFWRALRVATSVTAQEGWVIFGTMEGPGAGASTGVHIIDFAGDRLARFATYTSEGGWSAVGAVAQVNAGTDILPASGVTAIAHLNVRGVAATVLPGTRCNANRCGLVTPTIAAATEAGISVIHADGRVANSAWSTAVTYIDFDEAGTLWYAINGNSATLYSPYPKYVSSGFPYHYFGKAGLGGYPVGLGGNALSVRGLKNAGAQGSAFGLSLFYRDKATKTPLNTIAADPGVVTAHITNTYSTGHMVGDSKLALSESTVDTSAVVGGMPFSDDFSGYADTAALLAVWEEADAGDASTTITLEGEAIRVANVGTKYGVARTSITGLTVGATYTVTATIDAMTAPYARVDVFSAPSNGVTGTVLQATTTGVHSGTFIASATTMWLHIGNRNDADVTSDWSSIQVKRAVPDRSRNQTAASVVGTINKEAVAPGADLYAYRPAANSGLISPTIQWGAVKERCICVWHKPSQNYGGVIAGWGLEASNNAGSGSDRWGLITGWGGSGTINYAERVHNFLSGDVPINQWHMVLLLIRALPGGAFRREIWVDGRLRNSATQGSLPNMVATDPLLWFNGEGQPENTSWFAVALPRYFDTAPTKDQIEAMYAAERPLFEANAKGLLPAASVQGLAFDASRDELLVGTTAGTAVFNGLRRSAVINAAAVADAALLSSDSHKVLAAGDGVRMIGTAAEVYGTLPAVPLRGAALDRKPVPVYDPNAVTATWATSDATPADVLKVPVPEGFAAAFDAIVTAAEHGNVDGERAVYRITGHVARDYLGNVTVQATTTTVYESTGTMDAVAVADTTVQALDLTVTGLASKTLVWSARLQLTEIGRAH
tara:strand:- start:3310 stop:6429 length:3120 start_codon:yes stop_codon:yes gene_type:complete